MDQVCKFTGDSSVHLKTEHVNVQLLLATIEAEGGNAQLT